jgi:hypothetical protein
MAMNETQDMIRQHMGDELFFEFQIKFGGINIYISRPNKEAVWHYYSVKEMKERDIAMKLGVTEAFVYEALKQIRRERNKQSIEPSNLDLWKQE